MGRPDVCQKLLPRCLSAVLTFSLDLPLLSLFLTFSPSKFCPPCHPENALVPLPSASFLTSPQLGQHPPSECLEEDAKTTKRRKKRKSSKLSLATKRKRKKNTKTLRSMTTKKKTKSRKWKLPLRRSAKLRPMLPNPLPRRPRKLKRTAKKKMTRTRRRLRTRLPKMTLTSKSRRKMSLRLRRRSSKAQRARQPLPKPRLNILTTKTSRSSSGVLIRVAHFGLILEKSSCR